MLTCAVLTCAVHAALWQDILDGRGQADFEAANPLPEIFMNGTRAMMATFITTGCDTVRPLLTNSLPFGLKTLWKQDLLAVHPVTPPHACLPQPSALAGIKEFVPLTSA